MKMFQSFLLAAALVLSCTAAPASAQKTEQQGLPFMSEKAGKPEKPPVAGKININTATAEQIAMLPGVSLKKARGLVEYRVKNGNFKNIDDLKKIPGIKQKKIDKVKDYLIFEGETTLKPVESN